jgi:transposase InsO family protein
MDRIIEHRTALIDPGNPLQNNANESFNARLRDECLNPRRFPFRQQAYDLLTLPI